MEAQILVVDDFPEQAKQLAELVQRRTKATVAAKWTVQGALDAIRDAQIKVAILDQRMRPGLELDGTELAEEIQRIDPRVYCIIYSAQSNVEDYQHSNELRLRHLVKGEIDKLIQVVHEYRLRYLNEFARSLQVEPIALGSFRARAFVKAPPVVFEIVLTEDVSDVLKPRDDDYQTFLRTHSGIKRTATSKRGTDHEVRIEQASEASMSAEAGTKGRLFVHLRTRFAKQLRRQHQIAVRQFHELMSEESQGLTAADEKLGIVSVALQSAPLMRRRRATISVTCSCCGLQDFVTVGYKEMTGKFAMRRVEYGRGRKSPNIIDIGAE